MAVTKPPGLTEHSLPNGKVIPTFRDKKEERAWAKAEMAAAFRIFAKLGYADGSSGHMSLKDPVNSDLIWINPYAIHYSLIKVSDLVLVNEEGEIQEPTSHTVSVSGLMIHSSIHKARPDLKVACHVHSPYGTAWSAFGKPIEMLLQDSTYFYDDLSVYEGFGGSVLAREEGINIANALGPKNKSLILQNHGLLCCGGSVGEAVGLFIALERACQRQLLIEAAAANGIAKRYVPDAEAAYSKKYDYAPEDAYMSWKPEYDCILAETKGAFLE